MNNQSNLEPDTTKPSPVVIKISKYVSRLSAIATFSLAILMRNDLDAAAPLMMLTGTIFIFSTAFHNKNIGELN